jgi:hypothetical protein
MLARHPITGDPIRIIKTAPIITNDLQTLVWIRANFVESHRWQRWHVAISEPDALGVCGADSVGIVMLTANARVDDWRSAFQSVFEPKDSTTILVGPSAVITTFESAGLRAPNTLIIEDLFDAYPFLGEPVTPTDPLEKVFLSMAHILRMNRIAWSASCDRESLSVGIRAQYDAWMRTCGSSILSLPTNASDSVVPRCWLIQQYYLDNSARRAREIRTCLDRNLENSYIDHILLLNEKAYDLPANSKIQTVVIGHRLRYYDVFMAARDHIPAGDFVVFSNSDIWLDRSICALWKIPLYERRLFLALLRWEDEEQPRIFGPRSDSQDTWIFARDCLDFEIEESDLGFPFGKPGCDNAITVSVMRKRFLVVNPAYSIKTMHLHSSQVRRYDPHDVIYRPQFMHVDPTAIQGYNVVSNMKDKKYSPSAEITAAWNKSRLGQSFPRPLHYTKESDATTICRMLRQTGSWKFSATDANLWTPPPADAPLYKISGGSLVTTEGLVYNFREIYTGGHAGWTRGWESALQTSIKPCAHVPSMIALPFEQEWSTDLSKWILHYLPRALAVRDAVRAGSAKDEAAPEFLVPHNDSIGAFLTDCIWKHGDARGNITVVPYLENNNYYVDTVWAVPPVDDHALVTQDDVAMLRGLLPSPPKWEGKPIAVFCLNNAEDGVCSRIWAESVAENLFHTGWTVRYLSADDFPSARRKALVDASWIFGDTNGGLDWIWMAGAGATVMQFMPDHTPSGDSIHLAGACGLRYILGALKREPVIHQRQNALLAVAAAVDKYGFRELISSPASGVEKPLVVLPTGAALMGMWSHCGDTFREMVEIWDERNFVRIERRDDTPYCWWGGVGQTLLYDRPTPRWWLASPPPYQMALFGNCSPPGPRPHLLKQSLWSFWGRHPRMLEGIAQRVENMRGYESRPIASLFMGKIENGVQQAARTGADWSTSVELFSMPIDSSGKPYPYTQEQYLEKLCLARYGLCLPGYGPKCNREIEYFCCGVVPIVTPGVDIKGYLVPPTEGVHYFTAKTPEEVRRIVETTSAEHWAKMSAAGREWWRLYASAEGFFRLTQARIEQCNPYLNVGIPTKFI